MIAWIATILSFVGIYLNAKKNILCWPVWLVSDLFWAWYSIATQQWPLLLVQVAFVAGNIWGWKQWSK
jgi:nicotinamide mononucleotide transporter